MPSGYPGTNSGPCTVEECGRVSEVRGLCNRHRHASMYAAARGFEFTPEGMRQHRRRGRVDDYEFLRDTGASFDEIAARAGVQRNSLATSLRRAGFVMASADPITYRKAA